jgi:hypothetical protein
MAEVMPERVGFCTADVNDEGPDHPYVATLVVPPPPWQLPPPVVPVVPVVPPLHVALNDSVPPAQIEAGDELTVTVGGGRTVMSKICQQDDPLILYEMCAVPADTPVM